MFCVLNHQCLTSFDTTCLSMIWRHTHTVRTRKCGHDRDAVEITTISGEFHYVKLGLHPGSLA